MNFDKDGYQARCADLNGEFDYKEKGLEFNRQYRFSVYQRDNEIGVFFFSTLPGCCGVVVSHGLYINTQYRGRKYAAPLQALREHVARSLGYGAMIATVLTNNFPEVISSARAGWKLGPTFRNSSRTGNDVAFQIKLLTPVQT